MGGQFATGLLGSGGDFLLGALDYLANIFFGGFLDANFFGIAFFFCQGLHLSDFDVELAENIDRLIAEAAKLGLITPVYRLKGMDDDLDELEEAEWTPQLSGLRKLFETDAGVTIDGSDPKNIRVAFRRTRLGEGAQ